MNAPDLDTAVDAAAVTQLVLRERQNRDRGWWDDMAGCFAPDAIIEMSWFTGPAPSALPRAPTPRSRSPVGLGASRLSDRYIRCSPGCWRFATTTGGG